MIQTALIPLLGGALIGLSAVAVMLFLGRIAGISGILAGVIAPTAGDFDWRALFTAGLVAGGALVFALEPAAFTVAIDRSTPAIVAAGLLVGFGTRLGSGCTSGHGVCGLSRLSPRSLAATLAFMAVGMLTVSLVGGAA